MYNQVIEELVKNELNDLFFSYSYNEIYISDKCKEQTINSIMRKMQNITGSVIPKDIFNTINSVLDNQIAIMKSNIF